MTLWHALTVGLGLVVLVSAPAGAPAQPKALDDRMIELNITPVEPLVPPPLEVVTTTGVRVSLADVKGQAALVYFWATW